MTQNDMIQQAMEALHSGDADERAKAIELLGEEQHHPAAEPISEILMEADPGTAFIAAKTLGQLADAVAVPALLETLRYNDIWLRAATTGALIRIGVPSVEGLTHALTDADKAVRRAAAKALGKIGETGNDNQAVKALSAALLDVDDGVRRFAAEALGRLHADDKVSELENVLSDAKPDVRIAAFKALANIATPEAQKAVRNWVREQ